MSSSSEPRNEPDAPALRCGLCAAMTLRSGRQDRHARAASIWLRRAAELMLIARAGALSPAERARLAAMDAVLRDVIDQKTSPTVSKKAG